MNVMTQTLRRKPAETARDYLYAGPRIATAFTKPDASITTKISTPKVVQLLIGSQDGGADTFFVKLCVALHQAGLSQKIVISPHQSRERTFQQHDCDFEVIKFGGLDEIVARWKLKRLLAAYKPDIVVAWMNRAARRVPRGPYVRAARLGGYYPIRYYRNFDYLIANTPDIRRYMSTSGFPPSRSTMISNFGDFRDAAAQAKSDLGIPDDHALLLCLGRLHRDKGYDVAIQALKHIDAASLLIAGSGAEDANLKKLAHDCGLADRVKFLEWSPNTAGLLRSADACLVPSRDEPLSNVVLEAWRAGTPVIAARSAGPSWLIRSGEDGLLVPIDDPIALANAIQSVLSQPELRSNFIKNGRLRHEKEFSKASITQQYMDFYARISSTHHAEGRTLRPGLPRVVNGY